MPIGKPIPKKVLNTFLQNTKRVCVRHEEGCCSQILTIDHPFGRSGPLSHILIWLCDKHHGLNDYWSKDDFSKEINKYFGYLTVPNEELAKMKLGTLYLKEKEYLTEKYAPQNNR